MCASFNAAFNAIIIRNVHTARSPVHLVLSKETRALIDRCAKSVAPSRPFCFAPSINRFAQIAHFDVALLIRKNRAERGGRNTGVRRYGLFGSRT